ncbi:MAG: GIY-YIG nuclease family protein [Patescibacteria group bacterium]
MLQTAFNGLRGFAPHPRAALRMRGESKIMYYVYILKSIKDNKYYIGFSNDLKRRIAEHEAGKVTSTKHRRPFKLICYEVYGAKDIAESREKYLKSSDGHKDINKRFKK